MIYSLVAKRQEDVPPGQIRTGVVRFDSYLRMAIPGLESITPDELPRFDRDDIVIVDNHLSLLVPDDIRTVVTHHGMAQCHYDRDPEWRTRRTLEICNGQRKMFDKPNRTYVAPSAWVRDQFCRHYGLPLDYATVIVNWVPPIKRKPTGRKMGRDRLRIVGDFRDANKGAGLWESVARLLPQFEFVPLHFTTDVQRAITYAKADGYLCLSLSEGGSYSVADAEAAGLTVISTPVGNAAEFRAHVIPLDAEPGQIAGIVLAAMARGRFHPSFYGNYGFEVWAKAWSSLLEKVSSSG